MKLRIRKIKLKVFLLTLTTSTGALSVALIDGQSDSITTVTGKYELTWSSNSYGAYSCGGVSYASHKILERRNGMLINTYYISSNSAKSKSFSKSETGGYSYTVYYWNCSGSGGAYLIEDGVHISYQLPSSSTINAIETIYTHTDILGTVTVESDEQGNVL